MENLSCGRPGQPVHGAFHPSLADYCCKLARAKSEILKVILKKEKEKEATSVKDDGVWKRRQEFWMRCMIRSWTADIRRTGNRAHTACNYLHDKRSGRQDSSYWVSNELRCSCSRRTPSPNCVGCIKNVRGCSPAITTSPSQLQ